MKTLIFFGVLLIAGAATCLIHLSFTVLEGYMSPPTWFRNFLSYVSAAMPTVLIAPDLLMHDGALMVSVDNPHLPAGIIAIVTTWATEGAMWTIVGDVAVLLIFMKVVA